MAKRENEGFDEEDLIKAEFDSIVEGLSLDESSPTTYLDELDRFEEVNKFTPPAVPKKNFREQLREMRISFTRWRNNSREIPPDDGAVI
ncbi:hypothetical protein MCEMRE130_00840 [Candidatus Nanopelagicaceae bacterium]